AGEDVFAESDEDDHDDLPPGDAESPQPAAARASAGTCASAGAPDPASGGPGTAGLAADDETSSRSRASGAVGHRTSSSRRSTFGTDPAEPEERTSARRRRGSSRGGNTPQAGAGSGRATDAGAPPQTEEPRGR